MNYRPQNNYGNRRRAHGTAGGAIGSQSSIFGSNARTGAIGERKFASMLKTSPYTCEYPVWFGLGIPEDPTGKNKTRYDGDVDIAVASGNNLDLIDIKMWSASSFYWTLSGRPMKGFSPYRNSNGKWKPLSRNMELAVDRYKKHLPGVNVRGRVIFVPTNNRGAEPSSVTLLRWPGGIHSHLSQSGLRRIKRDLGKPSYSAVDGVSEVVVNPDIYRLLGWMIKGNGR